MTPYLLLSISSTLQSFHKNLKKELAIAPFYFPSQEIPLDSSKKCNSIHKSNFYNFLPIVGFKSVEHKSKIFQHFQKCAKCKLSHEYNNEYSHVLLLLLLQHQIQKRFLTRCNIIPPRKEYFKARKI